MNNGTKIFNSSDFESKIVNGVPAKLKGNEHLVSIRIKDLENEKIGSGYFCAGSLIAPHLVLTAAHCLFNHTGHKRPVDSMVVVMGSLRLNDSINSHQREVTRAIAHNQYKNESFQNDIGLLHLKKPFNLTSNIKVITYAQKADFSVGQVVNIAGWGITEAWNFSSIMMTADLKIVSRDVCKKAYIGINNVTDTMFCAADGEKGACVGDIGGPLVLKGVQYGIVSWDKGCGLLEFPGVYTDVASYVDWIKTNSGNKIIMHSATILSLFVAYFIVA